MPVPDPASFAGSASDALRSNGASLPTDDEFEQAYPEPIRKFSANHWSSVAACHQAAKWLVTRPGTRVLDVGCGPGKFCAIGAISTSGHFTGVEQRKQLCRTAWNMLGHYGIKQVQILHANVTEVAFNCFDAFYLFNPFEENLMPMLKISDEVPVHMELYDRYIEYVRREFSLMRMGTRIVTYWGTCEEVPPCYDCVETAFNDELKLWVKRREPAATASYWKKDEPATHEFSIV